MDFWHFCKRAGYTFTEEAPLAYATHMLCGDPYRHTLRKTHDLWASDWTGVYSGRLPDGQPWQFVDYFNEETYAVNPAIVHAMRSKDVLVRRALESMPTTKRPAQRPSRHRSLLPRKSRQQTENPKASS
jgi:hypothetical protein